MSYREADAAIISIAQHARPNPIGQIDDSRAQFSTRSMLVVMKLSSNRWSIRPMLILVGTGTGDSGLGTTNNGRFDSPASPRVPSHHVPSCHDAAAMIYVLVLILLATAAAGAPMTCDPAFTALFTPIRPHIGHYEVCTTPAPLGDADGEALEALDAFGTAGPYDRPK